MGLRMASAQSGGQFSGRRCPESLQFLTDFRPGMPDYWDSYPTTAPVGSFTADRFGLFDLAGNVREWCEDEYVSPPRPQGLPEDNAGVLNAVGQREHGNRMIHGGSWWIGDDSKLLSASIAIYQPRARLNDVGFRVVVEVGEPLRN